MFTLLNELHFWTFRSEIAIRDTDFASFCYYEKRTGNDNEPAVGKKSYSQERGIVWSPSNKRPAKLRNTIKELEECLESHGVIYSQWKEPDCLLVILESGLLISLKINILTGDLEHVHFDKHLLNKLSSEHVSDVAVGGSEAVFAIRGGKVLAVHYAKSALKSSSKHWVTVDTRSSDLVAATNQQCSSLRLRISSNSTSDKLAVWWERVGDPWQQMSSTSFPPIHIYHFTNLKPEAACCLRTEAQPVLVIFSQLRPNILHIVVQIISPRGDIWLGWCQMDISCLRGDRGTAVEPHRTVPVQSRVTAVSLSPAEDKILVACADSTLIVADYSYDCVVTNRTSFENSVRVVAWHPDSCILVAGDERANIQFFDSSLSPIRSQLTADQHSPLLYLDIGAYFKHQPRLLSVSWNKKPTVCNSTLQLDAFLFLRFHRGPLGVLKLIGGSRPGFPVDTVVCQYLSSGSIDRAISLLSTLAWDSAGSVALASLQSIVNYLLVRPLTPQRHELLERAVGSYFDSKRSISRVTCVEFNDSITDIRRRIFHSLLRYQVYEAALKLAVDLGHYDLLIDVHNQAKANGLSQLAITALEKAEQISEYSTSHSRSSVSSHSSYESSCSWCSRSSCSQCRQDDDDKRLKPAAKGQLDNNSKNTEKPPSEITQEKLNCELGDTEDVASLTSSKTSLLHNHSNEDGRRESKVGADNTNAVNSCKPAAKNVNVTDSHRNQCINDAFGTTKIHRRQGEQPLAIDRLQQDFDNSVRIDIDEDNVGEVVSMDLQNCVEMFDLSRDSGSYSLNGTEDREGNLTGPKKIGDKVNGTIQRIQGDTFKVSTSENVKDEILSRGVVWRNNGDETYGLSRNTQEGKIKGIKKTDGTHGSLYEIDREGFSNTHNFGTNEVSSIAQKDKENNTVTKNRTDSNEEIYKAVRFNVKEQLKIGQNDTNGDGREPVKTVEKNQEKDEETLNRFENVITDRYGINQNNIYSSGQTGDGFIHRGSADESCVIGEHNTSDPYSDRSRGLDGRISAEYDRDCLADVENGIGLEFGLIKSNSSEPTDRTENSVDSEKLIDIEKQMNLYSNVHGPNTSHNGGQNFINGFSLPSDTRNKNLLPSQGRSEMHRSSLWGKDRVDVQNVVGDQWFGSLVRVSKHLKMPSTSQNIYTESRESGDPEWTDYQTYRKPPDSQKHLSYRSQLYDNIGGQYQNNKPLYSNGRSQWSDPRLNRNMCDLQKESFISEDSARQRQDDNIPNLIHHNWMEPHSTRDHQGWRSNATNRWSVPSTYQNTPTNNQCNGYENDNLYERLNANVTRWNDEKNFNRFVNRNGAGEWSNTNTTAEQQPHEFSPARVGPNLWINPRGGQGSGIFWPKPYIGPRDRPPPPPPPPPPRPKVQFSESVTHIPLPPPHAEEMCDRVLEGNINTVGLPDASYHAVPRRQLNQKPVEPAAQPPLLPSQDPDQGDLNNTEDGTKVKVVHFGLV